MSEANDQKNRRDLLHRLEQATDAFVKSGIADYVELFRHPRRMIWLNFVAGLARGFGWLSVSPSRCRVPSEFSRLATLNLPIIGEFVADVARIVQNELRL